MRMCNSQSVVTKTLIQTYVVKHAVKIIQLLNFKKLSQKNFNIFHNNVNGLVTKHDLLHNFLTNNSMDFDIIAITETSLKTGNNFKTNIDLEGYLSFSIPLNSNKGGSTIYAKSDLNILERTDLNSTSDDYQSIWVEIKNEKSKNIICVSVYRHPCNNNDTFNHFLKYLEVSLNKVMKENKEIYLCGGFNIDLIKINEIINHRNFYELMSSYGLLPQILYPTREMGNSSTIIDNIFTNNVSDLIQSGNILTDFSDHYSQFIMVERDIMDFKTISVFSRDYSKFSVDNFRCFYSKL